MDIRSEMDGLFVRMETSEGPLWEMVCCCDY